MKKSENDKQISARTEMKERIVRTALEDFQRLGIRAVRMDDLATRMGISKRTLYEMFKDKEELLVDCILLSQQQIQARVKEIYDLESYGFCQGEIVLEVCYCGYERLAPRGVHWYSQRTSEKKEETDTSILIKKTERCSKCGFSIETVDERTLIDGAWYKTGIITNIYLDEETALTSRKDIFKLHSGIPLPDEEIPKAIEELEALLNDASCTLDDDMRRILTYYLEDLKNRQAN